MGGLEEIESNRTDDATSSLATTLLLLGQQQQQPSTAAAVIGWQSALALVVCLVIIIGTVLGNLLVCTAVAIVRRLRTPSNLLIVSLAVSDLLVASLVMTFAAAYEMTGHWSFGQAVCDLWTSLDVLLCTASILNLCAISIDRYFVITRPLQYAAKRTPVRMALMIVAVWVLSGLISIPPLFVGRTETRSDGRCELSQNVGYQIYATVGAFYVPLGLMIAIYFRIYMVSSRLAMSESRAMGIPGGLTGSCGRGSPGGRSLSDPGGKNTLCVPLTATATTDGSVDGAALKKRKRNGTSAVGGGGRSLGGVIAMSSDRPNVCSRLLRLVRSKSRLNQISSAHERKATKTLGVIMGAFTACWLPFFVLALVKLSCNTAPTPPSSPSSSPGLSNGDDDDASRLASDDVASCIWHSHVLNSVLLWLGYANSFLNPIIYARFNRDFRTPFKEILLCRCRGINIRLRNERYAEQFGVPGGVPPGIRSHRPSVDTVVRYNCSQGYTYIKVGSAEGPANFGITSPTAADPPAAEAAADDAESVNNFVSTNVKVTVTAEDFKSENV